MKDCRTCKYGYEDERLDIPMCHHPKRFSEGCVDFNMHEEKEIEAEHHSRSEKPNNHEGLDELVNSYLEEHRHDVLLSPYNGLMEFAKLVCEWQKKPIEGLEEAAKKADNDGIVGFECGLPITKKHPGDYFKAGAEWDRQQGVTIDGCVSAIGNRRWVDLDDDRLDEAMAEFHNDEKVIVQIRKK